MTGSRTRSRARREATERSSYWGIGGVSEAFLAAVAAAGLSGVLGLPARAVLGLVWVVAGFSAADADVVGFAGTGAGFLAAVPARVAVFPVCGVRFLAVGGGGAAFLAGAAGAGGEGGGAAVAAGCSAGLAAGVLAVATRCGCAPSGGDDAGWSAGSCGRVRSLSAASSNWPIPANSARSTTAGASLMRSVTCGIGMIISPCGACLGASSLDSLGRAIGWCRRAPALFSSSAALALAAGRVLQGRVCGTCGAWVDGQDARRAGWAVTGVVPGALRR